MRFSLKGRTVVLRPLAAEDRRQMITFAGALPEDDLLFLERDITQPAEVDAWIKDTLEGRLVTLVAWEDDVIVGYATFNRGHVRWTRHVAELRVVVAQSARGIGIGRLLLELAFEMVLDIGVTKVIARMTPEQTGAAEALPAAWLCRGSGLAGSCPGRERAHPRSAGPRLPHPHAPGTMLRVLRDSRLGSPGPGRCRLCSSCYESRYSELGTG